MFKVLSAFLLLSSVASAEDLGSKAKFKIKQVIKAQHQVVVSASEEVPFAPGKNFVATFDDGAQCSLTLSQINGKMLTLDSTPCDEEKRLTLKTPIEAALVTTTAAAAPVAATANAPVTNESQSQPRQQADANGQGVGKTIWGGRFGIFASAAYSGDLAFTDSEVSQNGGPVFEYDADVSFKKSFAPGIGLSYSKMEENSWGFSGSLYYEFAREFDNIKLKDSNGNAVLTYVGEDPKLSFFLIEANIVYRWERIYVPFGLSVSIPHLSNKQEFKVKPGVGIYAAIGTMITEDAAIELFLRGAGIKLEADDGVTNVDFKMGIMPSLGASLRYWF